MKLKKEQDIRSQKQNNRKSENSKSIQPIVK